MQKQCPTGLARLIPDNSQKASAPIQRDLLNLNDVTKNRLTKIQLLARALGASVRRMPYTEAGWQILERRAESAGSPWLAHLPESFSIFQWHGDTFTMPEGAQPLLSSRWCDNQAFAWGDKVLVLQGHPEMTEDLIALWLDDWAHLLDAGQPSQQSIDEMREGLSKKVRALNHVAEGFYAHWLKLAGL